MKRIVISVFAFVSLMVSAQNVQDVQVFKPVAGGPTVTNKTGSEYKFTVVKNIETTPVQNQGKTGTCWSFSSLSFFESELMKMGKGKDYNLSEMYVARMAYPLKAENYIRMHGKAQFAEGGEFHDVVNIIRRYGMVPEEVYNGNLKPGEKYNHKVMDSTLLAFVKEIVSNEKKIDPNWRQKLEEILDQHLGKVPQEFEYKGKKYTPQSYAKELGISPDDYVYVTSFTHHPWYSKFVIEIPDNWAWEQAQNVPLDEMMQTIDNAIMSGYGVGWAADVSEPLFKYKDGIALLPEKSADQITDDDKKTMVLKPSVEKKVTQEERQLGFDNYETQDDHGMHMVGIVKDQNGVKYYIVKNSWGKENECDGYFFASESYVRMKTVSIMINKKALPKPVAAKLKVK